MNCTVFLLLKITVTCKQRNTYNDTVNVDVFLVLFFVSLFGLIKVCLILFCLILLLFFRWQGMDLNGRGGRVNLRKAVRGETHNQNIFY